MNKERGLELCGSRAQIKGRGGGGAGALRLETADKGKGGGGLQLCNSKPVVTQINLDRGPAPGFLTYRNNGGII